MLTSILIRKEKIDQKLLIVFFVGYYLHSTGNRFLVVNTEVSEISNITIMKSKDVAFFEK